MRPTMTILAAAVAAAIGLAAPVPTAVAADAWRVLSQPAPLPEADATGMAAVNGVEIYYAVFGEGDPVVLLHGGLGNSEAWGGQVEALVAGGHKVVTIDSRGHGRSTRDDQPYGYHLMATDVLGVMDHLEIAQAAIVGWSDGGNIGLDLAINAPDRLTGLFALGANFNPDGVKPTVETDQLFGAYVERAAADYARLSPTPDQFEAFVGQNAEMWATEPNFTKAELGAITTPTVIAAGVYEEAIKDAHSAALAAQIPGAELLVLTNASHFAMWQDPEQFNDAVLAFLKGK